ncbi:gas vesicle protein GvpJ [Actinomycetospora sp.]|uniref:gas vesicle protein GvpJ n=1 Tax=Actinomycetospora sp. TaxID=1872135 RepID=UPI002F41D88E
MTTAGRRPGSVSRSPQGGLAEVLDLILDKGLVIDVFIKVSVIGIEILTIDARVVVASVDTYLRFAAATDRLDLHAKGGMGLDELPGKMTEDTMHGAAKGITKGVLDAGHEMWREVRDEHREKKQARRDR